MVVGMKGLCIARQGFARPDTIGQPRGFSSPLSRAHASQWYGVALLRGERAPLAHVSTVSFVRSTPEAPRAAQRRLPRHANHRPSRLGTIASRMTASNWGLRSSSALHVTLSRLELPARQEPGAAAMGRGRAPRWSAVAGGMLGA